MIFEIKVIIVRHLSDNFLLKVYTSFSLLFIYLFVYLLVLLFFMVSAAPMMTLKFTLFPLVRPKLYCGGFVIITKATHKLKDWILLLTEKKKVQSLELKQLILQSNLHKTLNPSALHQNNENHTEFEIIKICINKLWSKDDRIHNHNISRNTEFWIN